MQRILPFLKRGLSKAFGSTPRNANSSGVPPPSGPAGNSEAAAESFYTTPPPPPQTITLATQPPPADKSQYLRYVWMALAGGYLGYNMYFNADNPESWMNRSLTGKGKVKYQLKLERVDDQILQYKTAYVRSFLGPQEALKTLKHREAIRNIGISIDLLTEQQIAALLELSQKFRRMQTEMISQTNQITESINDLLATLASTGSLSSEADASVKARWEGVMKTAKQLQEILITKLQKNTNHQIELEIQLLIELQNILLSEIKTKQLIQQSPTILQKMKNQILNLNSSTFNELMLARLKETSFLPIQRPSRVFVLKFNGGMQAKEVELFREEVTAILTLADLQQHDEVLIRLDSPGGTVTGYGLAAAQIARLKEKGLKVTVSVDEVAASGGYLMAVVADKIYASPFAVIGSIGVILSVPVFYERLEREGVGMEDVTAGKYKRTMVPYRKPTVEDRNKVKESVESVFNLFKKHIERYRPQLNLDKVATGETWHGPDALALGLIDELKTGDDLILEHHAKGNEIFLVSVKPNRRSPWEPPEDKESMSWMESLSSGASYWLQQTLVSAFQELFHRLVPNGSSFPYGSNRSLGPMAIDPMYAEQQHHHQQQPQLQAQANRMMMVDPEYSYDGSATKPRY